MFSAAALLAIEIGIDPEIQAFGGLLLTWHGVFTAIGIAIGVYVAVLVARTRGFIDDDVYSAALIAIPCGIIGARALYVMERYGSRGIETFGDIFRVNEGGISIYGAIIGGLIGGIVYAWIRKLSIMRGLDVAAVGGIIGMAVGRIGDFINGEHFAEASTLPWAVRYTNVSSPSVLSHPECGLGLQPGVLIEQLCAQHPAVIYELIGDLLIFGVLMFLLRVVKKDGVTFFTFLLLYSLMRFGVSELRLDSRVVIWGLTTPQVTSLFLIGFSAIGLLYAWRRPDADVPSPPLEEAATGPPG
ncbi:MAG: prolipoprotein diacylglyceryl transferase [Chloroflexi bacterium]|nr:prolipoprotein diacylglyceryl transferase [Chloroflexota bacterium]